MTEAEYSPVQERLEGQQSVLADVPARKRNHFLVKLAKQTCVSQDTIWVVTK